MLILSRRIDEPVQIGDDITATMLSHIIHSPIQTTTKLIMNKINPIGPALRTPFRSAWTALVLLLVSGGAWSTPLIWESDFGAVLGDLTGRDDRETTVALSFDFGFQGGTYTDVVVGNNGGIRLGINSSDIDYDISDDFKQFNDDGSPTILPFNTDLDLSTSGTVHFNDFGTRSVFTWNEVGTHDDEEALSTFQIQLLSNDSIVFGYNGILDGQGEDLIDSLGGGILVGISASDGNDFGGSNLSAGFFLAGSTVYELWCYDEPNSCDEGRAGPINSAFDLDQSNVIFTPQAGGGFAVSTSLTPAEVPEPNLLALLAVGGLVGFGLRGRGGDKSGS